MPLIIMPPINIQMNAAEWYYVLGWIAAQDERIKLPPIIISLQARIMEAMSDNGRGFIDSR